VNVIMSGREAVQNGCGSQRRSPERRSVSRGTLAFSTGRAERGVDTLGSLALLGINLQVQFAMSGDLYPRLLGDAWWALAEPVRCAHGVGTEKHGCFRVAHGTGWLARLLVRWSGLPRAASAAETRLRIVAEEAGQRWERHFERDELTTMQWAEGNHLVERFGAWELCFELRVEDATLCYVQRGARLCLGKFRLPLPRACAPLVSARESCDGSSRVKVAVTVTLPLAGLLLAYDGHLDVGGRSK